MTVRELRQQASALGIVGYGRMKKAELEAAVAAAQAQPVAQPEFDVQTIGQGPIGRAAIALCSLIRSDNGKRGRSRQLRKALHRAGFREHAAAKVIPAS